MTIKINHDSLSRALLRILPSDNSLLYEFCNRYVCRYNGEGNGDIETNGELHLMRQVLPRCKTVFDIGANKGQWAKLALQINPHLNLHCFEPSRSTFKHLLSNKFPENVVCNNKGLSSTRGESRLHVFKEGSALNSLYRRQGLQDGYGLSPQQQAETVMLETMDAYCETSGLQSVGVDFCKVDVEGHELEVLRGMIGMLSKKTVKVIQFEYGGCHIDSHVLLKDFFDLLQPFDYAFYKMFPKKLLRFPRYDQRIENFQYQNWAIIANGYSID